MKEKTFYRLLTAVIALGLVSIIAVVVYSYILYSDCSILSYIANRG